MSITPERANQPEDLSARPALWPEHVAILKARGISTEVAEQHGLRSMSFKGLKQHFQRHQVKSPWPHLPLYDGVTGILIEYQQPHDGIPRFRVRADQTEVTKPGPIDGSHHGEETIKIPRYICQAVVPVVPYIPAEVFEISGDTSKPLYIVEAPLKALSLTAHGFPAIGLGGVLAGANDKDALDTLGEIVVSKELDRICWKERIAYVIFDAGISDNPMVALGAARLALALQRAGANVRFVVLPYAHPTESDPENGNVFYKNDQGPDDYIVKNGVEAFQKLVDEAVPADPAARVVQASGAPSRAADVGKLLGNLPFQAMLHEGGAVLVDQVAAVARVAGIGKKPVTDAAKDFGRKLAAKAKSKEPAWKDKLKRAASGALEGSVFNALVVLRHDEPIRDALGWDELREEAVWTASPPWEEKAGWVARPVTDDDGVQLVAWLDQEHGLKMSLQTIHPILDAAAKKRSFHPVRDYLCPLVHDGTKRVAGQVGPGWLTLYMGVPDSPYVRAVGRKFLVSAVARVMRPGCKVDTMLVLEGDQGKKKSTSIAALFGAEVFSDQLSDVTTKDASSDLRGKWVVEWSELDNLSRAEAASVKKYITRQTEDYRPAYGRRNIRAPRQVVFVGTTNKTDYLKDETGNRRFWPVKCVGEIDVDALQRDRDQLWAEALALFNAGERWWFSDQDGAKLSRQVAEEQEERRAADPWETLILAALEAGETTTEDDEHNVVVVPRPALNKVTTSYLLETVLKVPMAQIMPAHQKRVGACLSALGWHRRKIRIPGLSGTPWGYVRPGTPDEPEPEPQPVPPVPLVPPAPPALEESKPNGEKNSSLPTPSALSEGEQGEHGEQEPNLAAKLCSPTPEPTGNTGNTPPDETPCLEAGDRLRLVMDERAEDDECRRCARWAIEEDYNPQEDA